MNEIFISSGVVNTRGNLTFGYSAALHDNEEIE